MIGDSSLRRLPLIGIAFLGSSQVVDSDQPNAASASCASRKSARAVRRQCRISSRGAAVDVGQYLLWGGARAIALAGHLLDSVRSE